MIAKKYGLIGRNSRYYKSDEQKQNRLQASRRDVRILNEGDMYTQDYKPQRLNIEIDQSGIITRVWCG